MKKIYLLFNFLFYFIFLFTSSLLANEIGSISLITLKGYLGKEELLKVSKHLEEIEQSSIKELVVEVNSSSGDLDQTWEVAKKIYQLKTEKDIKVIVFIENNALGPAAMVPFLADDLYISFSISWGDIPLGTESTAKNIWRNRVISLIPRNHPKADLLKIMAAGMSDSSVEIVDHNGWKIASDQKDVSYPVISYKGETLVVNQNQLKDIGLIKEITSQENFQSRFHFSKIQSEIFKQGPQSNGLTISSANLERRLKDHIKFNERGSNQIGYIIIANHENEITQGTWLYVKNALDYYKKTKPAFIILELNTPGGEVFAAQKISDALKEMDTQYNIPVIAFINNWAISAGAMLAYSCRFIAVVKDASMGAAEPITISGTEMKEASEKVNSALRADFANRASFFDRNPYIAESMVDKDLILVIRHNKIIRLDSDTQIQSTGPNPDIVISRKGKLLTLNSEQLIKYGVADILLLPQKLELITGQERDVGKWPASKMLLFHAPFFNKIPNATIDAYKMDWKTQFFVFLAHPVVSSLLFLGIMIGFYLEITSPGVSLPGTIAGLCLFLIILSSFAQEIGNILELIFLVVGILIILVELFVLPTFGLLGFLGILFFLVGLFGLMLPGIGSINFEFNTHSLNAAGEAFFKQLAWLSGTMVVGFIIIAILARYIMPSFGGWNRFVLIGHEQEGYIASDNPEKLPAPGSEGEAISPLRKTGKVIIHDSIYDAVSDIGFIEKGTKIVVDRLEGSVIIVKAKE